MPSFRPEVIADDSGWTPNKLRSGGGRRRKPIAAALETPFCDGHHCGAQPRPLRSQHR